MQAKGSQPKGSGVFFSEVGEQLSLDRPINVIADLREKDSRRLRFEQSAIAGMHPVTG
jgi:hypothetical protein